MIFPVVGTCPCAEQKTHTPKVVQKALCLGSSLVPKRKSCLVQDLGSMLANQSCLWLPLRFYRRVFPQQTACIPTRSPLILTPAAVPPAAVCLLGWHRLGWHGMGWHGMGTTLTTPAHLHLCPHTHGKRTSQTGIRLLFSCLLSTTSKAMAGAAHSIFSGPFIS